jgi:Fe-S cluster assembly protein SufD
MVVDSVDSSVGTQDAVELLVANSTPGARSPQPSKAAQRATYYADLLATVTAAAVPSDWEVIEQVRSQAQAVAQEMALPSTRDEDWRFTDLSPMLATTFLAPQPVTLAPEAIAAFEIPEAPVRVVVVNGQFVPELSNLEGLPDGVTIGPLTAVADREQLAAHLGQQGSQDAFSVLNAAGLSDGVAIELERRVQVVKPIHLLYVATADQPAISQPRCLVLAKAGDSHCTLIEDYVAIGQGSYCTNSVMEVVLGNCATLHHVRLQREGDQAIHIGKTATCQDWNSHYTLTTISNGAAIARHSIDIAQMGPGTETILNGLSIAVGEQLTDTHSSLVLNHPHGTADQLHKCIADDRGHTVFNGRVFVGHDAQQTNAAQLNRNLLLSPKARADTKPQLEIIADDVKCSHGSTVSQLEDSEVFYCRSRGLDLATARALLLDGFAGEILARLPIASLRSTLARCISQQIGH